MANVRARGGSMAITIDASQLERKMAALKDKLPDELRKQLRKELSAAVKPLVQAQRAKVKGLTTKGSSGGGRTARYPTQGRVACGRCICLRSAAARICPPFP